MQVQHKFCTRTQIYIQKREKMLTLKLFDGFLRLNKRSNSTDAAIMTWAKLEFKNDANYAFFHMKEYGVAPNLGVAK